MNTTSTDQTVNQILHSLNNASLRISSLIAMLPSEATETTPIPLAEMEADLQKELDRIREKFQEYLAVRSRSLQ